jgi:PIN domain nuclease of toxin-antitoxin system
MQLAVTDTHPLLHYASVRHKALGDKALKVFQNADRRDGSALIQIPAIVLIECFLQIQAGKVKIPDDYEKWVKSLEKHEFFRIQPMTLEEVIRASNLTTIVDPFDRMIVASAQEAGYPLITKDTKITESSIVEVIWDE